MKRITIETPDNTRVGLKATGSFKAEEVIRILFSAMKFMLDGIRSECPEEYRSLAGGDLADMINFAASNLCNHYAPKDPEAEVDEHILLQCEDMIKDFALSNGLSLEDAARRFNAGLLSFRLVHKKGKEVPTDMACAKKKKKKGCGGC